jgi:hypothetical protein
MEEGKEGKEIGSWGYCVVANLVTLRSYVVVGYLQPSPPELHRLINAIQRHDWHVTFFSPIAGIPRVYSTTSIFIQVIIRGCTRTEER